MLRNISVILVRTRFPENIGMAARAMANMGVSDLVLVRPERWDKDKALPLATGQGLSVLENCRVTDSLEEALKPFVAAFGTTARTGGWRRDILRPEGAAAHIMDLLRETDPSAGDHCPEGVATDSRKPLPGRVALVFGPEDRGLLNQETELCTRLVNIPTALGSSSLNLAQAVLLILYECMKAEMSMPSSPGEDREWTRAAGKAESRRATLEEEALLMRTLEETLIAIGHLPEDNSGWFMQPMRRFLRKSQLRRHEFDMIMGICRKVRRIRFLSEVIP